MCKQCKGTGLANFAFTYGGFEGGDWDGINYCRRCYAYGILDAVTLRQLGLTPKYNFIIINWADLPVSIRSPQNPVKK